jgi:hypothetical protein
MLVLEKQLSSQPIKKIKACLWLLQLLVPNSANIPWLLYLKNAF